MDETEEDARYLSNYGVRPEVSVDNVVNHHSQSQQIADSYINDVDDDDEVEEDEEQGVDNRVNGVIEPNGDDFENEEDGYDDDDNDNDDDDGVEDRTRSENYNLHRHPKKRKLKSLLSSFELVPRVPDPTPLAIVPRVVKRTSLGGRNMLTDWSEHETFALLEAWGSRFLERGRKSLRSEEWQEVAENVSKVSKMERTDTQCRNRLDTLKKKYKKEKALLEGTNNSLNTKWVYFKKMDMLMSSTPMPTRTPKSVRHHSGEFDSVKPNVNSDSVNIMDNMRDSPGESDSDDDDDDLDLLPPTRSKNKRVEDEVIGGSFRLLADSINKFSDIYEKIETRKRKQMMELEKMRMDFIKELELQKKQILERARDEIAKIRQKSYEDNDSAENNISG